MDPVLETTQSEEQIVETVKEEVLPSVAIKKPKRELTEAQKLAFKKAQEKRAANLERKRQQTAVMLTEPAAEPKGDPLDQTLLHDIVKKLDRIEETMISREETTIPREETETVPKLRLKRAKVPVVVDVDPETMPPPPPVKMPERSNNVNNLFNSFNWI